MPRNDVNVWAGSATTGTSYALMPTTGTFSTLCVDLTTAPGTGASWTWTLYKNGLDEYVSVKISGAQTQACDLVDTAGFVPGDLVALHVTPSSSPAPASTYSSWYIVQTPAVPGETILFGSQQLGSQQYLSLAGNSSSLSVEADMATVIPTTGTVTKFIAEYVGTGSSVAATLDHNEASTPLTLSLSASGTYVEQADNLSIAAGDALDVNETGITASSAFYASAVFVPNVAGQFVIPTWRNAESDHVTTYYLPLTGRGDDSLETIEAQAQQIGGNVQIQGEYVLVNNAPGTGAQYAFTLRDNGASTALNTVLSGTNLAACTTSASVSGCTTGSAVAVNNFDLLDTMVVATGSPASSPAGVAVSYLAYVPQLVFTTEPPATGTAGTTLSPVVVELEDENGNAISGSSAQVTISSSPAGVSGTVTVAAVNGVATFNNLSFATSGTYTLTASVTGLSSVTSSSITIGGGAAPAASLTSSLSFPNTAEGTTSAAMAATLSNSGAAALNNIAASITGTNPSDFAITTGTNACGSTLAAGSSCSIYVTFTPASVASFSATLSVADNASGSPQTASLTGTGVAGAASKLAFTSGPPSSGTTGTPLSPVTVQVEDSYGNVVTGSSAPVTISSTPAGVSGTLTANAVNGVATFNNLVFSSSGSYTLSAASSGLSSVTSGSILISPSMPTSQFILGAQPSSFVPTTGQNWIGFSPRDEDLWAASATTGTSYALMPTTGTFSSLCVNLTAAPGAGASWIWSLYKNGADQAVTVTISGSETQACDSVDTTGFLPGDLVALHVTPSASPAPADAHASWYIVQTPAVPGETILFASHPTSSSYYFALGANGSGVPSETEATTIIPTAGTITKYIAEYVGPSAPVSSTVDQNESPTSLSASTPTSGTFVEQTGNLSVSTGDVFDVYETGLSSSSAFYASMVFVPSVPGQFVIPSYRNAETQNSATTYFSLTGRSGDAFQPNVSLTQEIGGSMQIQSLFTQTTVAPGSGAEWTYTLSDNDANTSLNTTTSGTNFTSCTTSTPVTGCAIGSPVTVNNFDLLSTAATPTNSPAISDDSNGVAVSYLAYTPQLAFSTEPPATGTTGTALSQVVVELQDENGNPLSGSTAQVTISSSPTGVSGTLTVNAVNGVATFNNLVFNATGTYTLSAVATGLTPVTSTSISISAASAPVASLSSPVNFPNTAVGTTSSALAATLSNTGNATLVNIVPSITGANPSDFAITSGTNACGSTLLAGSNCSIYITFRPASASSFTATLSVANNASGSPQTSLLAGTGTAPVASLTPSLSFPNTLSGTSSSALVATLSNSGTAALIDIVPSIAGSNPSDFAIAAGANACGSTLAAGSSCYIYVTFTPASAASFSALLSVADNASGSPQTSTLTGTGTAPGASLTSPLSFPNTLSGTTSAALAATLSNNGTATLNNIVPTITGANSSDFAITTGANACGATLAANATCSIYVTFTPASAVSFSATLSVADSASSSPQTSTLTGTGTAPGASLTSSIAFPNTLSGTTSAALAATLSNTGTATLNNILPTITGANPSDFAITTGSNACSATLAANATCSIYVTFTPSSAASFSATLSVADSASSSPQTSSLTGTGTAPAAAQLAFTTQPPATGIAGTPLSPVVVQVEDSNGNLVAGSAAQVTITSTPAGVGGTLSVSAVGGVATFSNLVFAASGSYTLSAASAGLTGATSNSISVVAPVVPTYTVTGNAVSITPGATSGNTAAITVTPAGGFTGSVTLTAAVTSSPTGAQYPPTFSFGSTSPVSITGASAETATLTILTTAPTSSVLVIPTRPGAPWFAAGGAAFACMLFFGIPARRRARRNMLGMLALLVTLAAGAIACGGSGGGGGGGIAGTTAGAYVVTVTATSGTTTETGTINLTVQ
jgi:hypothetical protein